MKIAIASDLHLEFANMDITNDGDADVLVLAGDILVAEHLYRYPENCSVEHSPTNPNIPSERYEAANRYRNFLKNCSERFPHVVYVAGNHEFYDGKFNGSLAILRAECEKYSNIYFMEDNLKKIDDVTFVGSTLWTDMNKEDPLTLHAVREMMHDYQIIRHDGFGNVPLRPAHTVERHKYSLDYIKMVMEGKFDEKFVVVSHMAPCTLSIHPRYKDSSLMNGAYASELSEFILDHPQIKVWFHGHVHSPFDYCVGDTRVVCNPRGYVGYEPEAKNFNLKYATV